MKTMIHFLARLQLARKQRRDVWMSRFPYVSGCRLGLFAAAGKGGMRVAW
jgi:hypothetical protein